jgi:hypothetical protein
MFGLDTLLWKLLAGIILVFGRIMSLMNSTTKPMPKIQRIDSFQFLIVIARIRWAILGCIAPFDADEIRSLSYLKIHNLA